MFRATLLVAASAAPALAQPVPGGAPIGDMPLTLDPGAGGTQIPSSGRQPAAQQPAQPNVIVVGADGKVTNVGQQQSTGPGGYYVSGGDNGVVIEDTHAGPTPELHVVSRGDTLWSICGYYFNDPFQWPKVWSYNPQITNPHWIYPGDLVRLLPRGVFQPDQPLKQPDQQPADNTPPPAKKLEVGLRQVAFVEQSDLDTSITIDGAVDEKELLGDGDSVYLSYPPNKPPEVGKKYTIYQPGNGVKENGKQLGSYVHILGTLEVVSVKQDKRARGVILEANQEIERGAKVGPLVKLYKNVPPVAPKQDAQGSIVAMITADQLIGQGELVMVDLGKGSGVEVGNRMFVVRRGDAVPDQMDLTIGQDDRRFPARALGEVVIVEVGDNISVALVTLAVQEMGVGDLVMMQKSGGAK
nr:LysM peptidoglycan-binding domain-containing protein [Kofleriaceae bacterium]